MRGYYGQKNVNYFDLKYRICTPIDTTRYPIPNHKETPNQPFYDNQMVNHILQTLYQTSTKKDALEEEIDNIFRDRQTLIRSKIELILLQLEQRKKINQEVLYDIDKDSCKAQNLIFEMGYRVYRMDKDRITLEKTKLDLESQKRLEEVSYFRDIGMLNRDLTETLIQYLSEVQKTKLIETEGEE
jgi:hypothetical protein